MMDKYRRLVRISAVYDLLVTAAFATPWSLSWLHQVLRTLDSGLPALDPLSVLFGNLMGSLVCVWAVLRIRQPQVRFGLYDGIARLLFATWQGWALCQGMSLVLLPILVLELVWAAVQLWPWLRPAHTWQDIVS